MNTQDKQSQVQSAEWVLVPREPTEGMLKAAEDAVDAASNCESTTDDLSAIAYKAALAAAPQPQAAEPFMYTWSEETDKDGVFRKIPLYTHPPQPTQDAKDAARYRWLRDAPQELVEVYFATDKNPTGWGDWNSWKDKDAGIDTHMAKESGR